MNVPMLADFAVRLACGLAVLLLLTRWRLVPPPFFRTHCLVILGLLVLATLDVSRVGLWGPWLLPLVVAATAAYLAAVGWGLGVPRLAMPLTWVVTAACAGAMAVASKGEAPWWGLTLATRLASAFLMGATLSAMLLGHYYLTAPAMSIEPLKRFVGAMAVGLTGRTALAGVGLGLYFAGWGPTGISPFLLGTRWGMGVVGPVLATVLAWKTVEIRSTQSATGILYITMTLVLFGELSAMILSRESGLPF